MVSLRRPPAVARLGGWPIWPISGPGRLRAGRVVALGDLGLGGVVVVDELGKMELASAAFRDAVMQLLGWEVAVATVQLAPHRLTDALRRRPDIRVVRVTEASRDALAEQLRDWLVGTPQGRSRDRSVRCQGWGEP
jgi:hypothetical protein